MKQIARPPTLTTVAADAIRETIFRGELQPGGPLREVELGESLSVSRGTVREALRLLHEELLVEIFPFRGAFVTRPTPRAVREIYSLRALLEPYAVRVAMEMGAYREHDLEALGELVQRIAEREEAGDVMGVAKADLDFHYLICARSDHRFLLQLFRNLQSLNELCMLVSTSYHPNPPTDDHHHRHILDAIGHNDPVRAAEILKAHIDESRDVLLAGMEDVDEADLYAFREGP